MPIRIRTSFSDSGQIAVQDDLWIGFHAVCRPGAGHVVYAGTGSVGMHIRADGSVVKAFKSAGKLTGLLPGATQLSCSAFGQAMISHM